MMPEPNIKNLPYLVMLILFIALAVVMVMEKIDICLGLVAFILLLTAGMFHLLFLESR